MSFEWQQGEAHRIALDFRNAKNWTDGKLAREICRVLERPEAEDYVEGLIQAFTSRGLKVTGLEDKLIQTAIHKLKNEIFDK